MVADAFSSCSQKICAAYPISDLEPVSTSDLLRLLAAASGVSSRLFPLPPFVLRWLLFCLGRAADFEKLSGSFVVDSSGLQQSLRWKPPYSLKQGLSRMLSS